ncbi:MAG: hypothetical protein V1754_01435 [Pseudomonadota bacterium]
MLFDVRVFIAAGIFCAVLSTCTATLHRDDSSAPRDCGQPDLSLPDITSKFDVFSSIDKGLPSEKRYFPSETIWYSDISNASKDFKSDVIIAKLIENGGWGTGEMRIDFSLHVLEADASTTMKTFNPTEDFFEPDCEHASVPVPLVGAVEGNDGYVCEDDGDCHLIVRHATTKKLFEMWRANIVGTVFDGGCLVVWDLTKTYGWNQNPPTGSWGIGMHCTSADAAGFPISPLLFSADEIKAGAIKHAIRFILPNNRIASGTYVYPATHATFAASANEETGVPYGARFRLRADFPIESLATEGAKVVARAMQKHGMFLADGGTIALTAQSDRFTAAKWTDVLGEEPAFAMDSLKINDFEMVDGGERFFQDDCVRNN